MNINNPRRGLAAPTSRLPGSRSPFELDADVLAWLKSKGDGYQTKVNSLLREKMLAEIRK